MIDAINLITCFAECISDPPCDSAHIFSDHGFKSIGIAVTAFEHMFGGVENRAAIVPVTVGLNFRTDMLIQ